MSCFVPDEMKLLNRAEIERATNILNGQKWVISNFKNEMMNMCTKFKTMSEFLENYPDRITALDKSLYDKQTGAFVHILFLYLSHRNSEGDLYINPVTI
jgi:hypothetical protein